MDSTLIPPSSVVRLDILQSDAADIVLVSPNQDGRPAHAPGIACVVLHATADEGDEHGAEGWMCDARSRVSAHLHIRRDGTVVRLVRDRQRAWHAGRSAWRSRANVNDFSLGWEMANRNDGVEPYSAQQYESVARLAAQYVRQGLPLEAFVSHAAVALPAGRKSDPAGFDWERFRSSVKNRLDITSVAARSRAS